MPRRPRTRGEVAIAWVEDWLVTPNGKPVRLSPEQRAIVRHFYDGPISGGVRLTPPEEDIVGPLAAYLSLYHLCGPEARFGAVQPQFKTDVFSLWAAAGPELRTHLRRHGAVVTCPGLGTIWSAAA